MGPSRATELIDKQHAPLGKRTRRPRLGRPPLLSAHLRTERPVARGLASDPGGRSSNRRTSNGRFALAHAVTLRRIDWERIAQLPPRPLQMAIDGAVGVAGQLSDLLAAVAYARSPRMRASRGPAGPHDLYHLRAG